MEPHYDVEAWAVETTLGRRIFNHGFWMSGSELAGWSLVKSVVMHRDAELLETTHLWRNDAAPERELVSVNVAELAGWPQAQRHLLAMLDHSMRGALPRGAGALADLGDVTFVGRAPESDMAAATLFARGNVAVAINSAGSAIVDVSRFALLVDRMLAATGAAKFLPPARHGAVTLDAGKRGEELPLDVDLAGNAWVKLVAPDGELRRKGDALLYSAAEPGMKTLDVFGFDPQPYVRPPDDKEGESGTAWPWWKPALIVVVVLGLLYLIVRAAVLADL